MAIARPNPEKYRYYLLSLLLLFLCSAVASGKNGSNNGRGHVTAPFSISTVGPNSGPTSGGTSVKVLGTGFTHSASVTFDGVTAPSVTYIGSTALLVTTPPHASGTVSVVVTENPQNQSATLAGGFTYGDSFQLSGASPSQGPTTGGTVVTIAGTGFQTGATVAFGSTQSSAVTVASSTQIDAVSPPESAGSVAITVTGPNGQAASLPSAFTYTSGPSISSVSPTSGPVTGGTTVTIMGSGFQSSTSVAFGGISATTVKFVSSTELQAVTPSSSAGTVAVAVADSSTQTATLASAYTFYHTVSLTWTESSTSISGYNVYRSSTSGGPYTKINSVLIPGTSFTDDNVQAGQTYFYVTTAVNTSNTESSYSNQTQTVVPSP